MILEGYWRYNEDEISDLPFPTPITIELLDMLLRDKRKFLDELSVKENKAEVTAYNGISICRLCKKPNGCTEFELDDWRWPEGFRHYIEEHNVCPSMDFIEFIKEV